MDYCRADTVVKTSYVKSTDMSHDRFLVTLTRLYVNNNENRALRGQPGYDPQNNICPTVSKLTRKFHEVYTSKKILMIDETICAF
jgi:hypothetical protein